MANCKDSKCVVWWDSFAGEWTIYSDCPGDCRCPLDEMEVPRPGEPAPGSIHECKSRRIPDAKALLTAPITFADSWLMQRHCDAYCDIGCEWSLGDGKVHRTGFASSGIPQPRYQVLSGQKAELVIFGGMSNGTPNVENGLPEAWIIGYADFQKSNNESRRMNIAGFTSFKLDSNS